ncbi:PLC-like phosphodiesterase [Dactylonectria estremocensis]|uniref:PLC-like phosphodiesterase n=1 Tax=Dactylonectria estremocensis TaxID=1079267 RepID=A0A9P9J481_9HYPO|nr:PLC-like phosphodiesterase [Dactylonectria estremocensis]
MRPPNPDATAMPQAARIHDHTGAAQHGQDVESLFDTNKGTKVIDGTGHGHLERSDPLPTRFVIDTDAVHSRLPDPDVNQNHIAKPNIPATDDPNTFLGPDPFQQALHSFLEPNIPAIEDPSNFLGLKSKLTLKQEEKLNQKQQPHDKRQAEEVDGESSKRLVSVPEVIFQGSTLITLINATPFRWRKGYSHSYQLRMWEEGFPEYIEPGKSEVVFSARRGGNIPRDSAGEVVYHFEGTSKPMSFMIQRRRGKKHPIFVQFLEEFETNVTRKHSQMNLGFNDFPGGSVFIVAGKEGDFLTTAPPGSWMQTLLPHIGHLPLREIALPRSHHSGMSKAAKKIGFASKKSTLTQTKDVKYQMNELGVRVLDIRPILLDGKFRAAHGAMVVGLWNGRFGESLEDIARAVGDFHKAYPGEMIIIDIPAPEARKLDCGKLELLGENELLQMYEILVKFTKPFQLPDNEDITKWPLNRFIGNKQGGTIIRVSPEWTQKRNYPGGVNGFVSDRTFPLTHRWSNKMQPEQMYNDQIEYLRRSRDSRQSRIFHSDWIITLSDEEAVFPTQPITERALQTYSGLYNHLWNVTNDSLYPNWIAMDSVQSTELATFAMVINKCFAAGQCGEMGGKVKDIKGKGKNTKEKSTKGKNTKAWNA